MSPEETSLINRPVGSLDLPGGRIIPSAALIGAGLLLEPELWGGTLIGAGVVYGLPLVAHILRPLATTAVQLGYSAVATAGGLLAGARNEVEGILANPPAGYQRSPGSSNLSEP